MATYYLYNGSKNVNIYSKANTKSTKKDTLKKGHYLKASGLSNGFYIVSKGYIRATDVYADNMGDTSGDGKKMYKNYKTYFNESSDVGSVWKNKTPGDLVLFSEKTLTATSKVFVYSKTSAANTNDRKGYLNSGCSITVVDLVNHDPITMAVRSSSNSTVENGEGLWYKIYKVTGEYGGSPQGKWVNLTTYGQLLKNNGSSTSKSSSSSSSSSGGTDESAAVVEEKTIDSYSSYKTKDEYYNDLQEGLKVKDLRNIFGMPYQFLPLTDPRIDDENGIGTNDGFGAMYTKKIINPMPLLLITPGSPEFMTSYNKSQRELMLEKYLKVGIDSTTLESLVNEKTGKFYSLRYNYTEYFYYVNAMCRSGAFFLGIEDTEIDGKKLKEFNWLWDNSGSTNSDIFGHEGLFKFLGPYAGAIPFYIEAETSITDSFSNSTSSPSIADTINGLSDQARELNFLMGTASSAVGGALDNFVTTDGLNDNLEAVTEQIQKMMPGNNILANLTNHVSTLLSGGKMIFPEIWNDSSFSRSYDIKIKIPIPSGDKLSIYLYGLVAVFHCMGLVLPRQSASQAYYSPFLVRACYKGIFNVDMGIVDSMSFTKGSDGEWTDDGLPTVIEISMGIKDLYNGMFMSKQEIAGDMSILSNITELDYIANMCGININEPDVRRTVEMYLSLGFVSNIKDRVQIGIWGGLTQWTNQKLQNIFGKF